MHAGTDNGHVESGSAWLPAEASEHTAEASERTAEASEHTADPSEHTADRAPAPGATATLSQPTGPTAWLPAGVGVASAGAEPAPDSPAPLGPSSEPAPPRRHNGFRAGARQPIDSAVAHRAAAAYCQELCDPATAAHASDEAVASWTARGRARASDPDALLAVTREVAAHHASRAAKPGWRGVLSAEHESECDLTLSRLADASAGRLSDRQRRDLDAHTAGCLRCQATVLRTERAERAFRTKLNDRTEPVGPVAAADDNPRDTSEWALPAAVAAASAAAPAAEAASNAGAQAATTTVDRPPDSTQRDPGRRQRLAAAVLVLAAIAAGAILLIGGPGNKKTVTSSRRAAAPAVVAASHPAHRASHRVAKPHKRAVVHHARSHKAKHAAPAAAPASQPTAAATTPVTSSPSVSTPSSPVVVTPSAPVVQSPPPTGSSGPSVSIHQGSGLPASNAPTQGIGSGGSSGSKH